ncbi:uncharacterized protein LOC115884669 [Sitophilus oryzae]|uniref:Uncharacterized protein LOC115884669 n=1 Tax=Sitophilus oryzae TaxID=7048 RepID=A0A6J2Y7J0_SITOR|nr:uncharacterized protein LOC115884669 [Sitophilus oryzae]
MLLQKLNVSIRTDFEVQNTVEIPTYSDLTHFLENKCKALESVQFTTSYNNEHYKDKSKQSYQSSSFSSNKKSSEIKTGYPAFMTTSNNNATPYQSNKGDKLKCVLCSSSHALYRCFSFLSKTPQDRLNFAQQHNLCTNCLLASHSVRKCNSSFKCKICGSPHHTLLHLDKAIDSYASNTPINSNFNHTLDRAILESTPGPSVGAMASTLSTKQSTVLLSTAIVDIKDIRGNFQQIRILFDSASMANFITEKCVNRLGLPRKRFSIPIEGLNGMSAQTNQGVTHCTIKPCNDSNPLFSFDSIILPKICSGQPKININPSSWTHIQNLKLADYSFHKPGPIDLLIGAELVPHILRSGRILGEPGQPVALETIFGYILQGMAVSDHVPLHNSTLLSCHTSIENNLDIQLQKFWEVEEIPKISSLSTEDVQCEEIYRSLTYRDQSGRFCVPLPFKIQNPFFRNTCYQARRPFISLEFRLAKNPELRKAYFEFMQDYLNNGHMVLIPPEDYNSPTAYYIPHHSVIKNEISGPKLRVVFLMLVFETRMEHLSMILYL